MPQARAPEKRRGSGLHAERRSAIAWSVRGALAVGALGLAYVSVSESLANVMVDADPGLAVKLAFRDGPILAAEAAQSFGSAPQSSSDSRQAQLARAALRLDPTAVGAVDVLALQAELRSERARADGLFAYSVALSRRELQPQLWAIEQAVGRGDIDEALRQYDLAMRTSDQARDMLYPALASAIAEPLVRDRLVPLLVRNPVWAEGFIRYASSKAPAPEAVAQLFRESAAKDVPIDDSERAQVVASLVNRDMMDEAWDFYRTFRRSAVRDRSRDPDFALATEAPAPFDWKLSDASGVSAAILPGARAGILDFAAAPSVGATVASQLEMLPAGRYRLEGRSRGVDQPDSSLPYWVLSCQAGPELGRADVPSSGDASATFSADFSVPADCPVQTLSLVVRASGKISGVSGQIEHVQLAATSS
jgi:hypothetical protein